MTMDFAIPASIDIGSNTIRLLVASLTKNGIKRLLVKQKVTRLGEGLKPGGSLSTQAKERTLGVLRNFCNEALALKAGPILAGATGAVRETVDGKDFASRVKRELGLDVLILTARQEADLTAAGVLNARPTISDPALIFDLGGRSTEFILTQDGHSLTSASLALGAVSLTEAFFRSDPPTLKEIRALRVEVGAILCQGLAPMLKDAKPKTLIGTAGTVTTLAAMAQELTIYQPELVHNFRLTRKDMEGLFRRLAGLTAAERALIPGLPEDRADIIVAGAGVVLELIRFINTDQLIVSDAGLLEGLWLAAAGLRRIL